MPEQITIIAENRVSPGRGLIAEHGFSALVELEGFKLLFDTGQGFAIKQNQALLGYDLSQIDALVLSHGHYDHTGGLKYVLEKRAGTKIYLHPSALLPRRVKRKLLDKEIELDIGIGLTQQEIEDQGGELVFLEEPLELAEGRILITGPIPLKVGFETPEPGFFIAQNGNFVPDDFPDDLAIAIRSGEEISVIFGCAHRGAINTLRRIKELWNFKQIKIILGGTHLFDRTPEQVEMTISEFEQFSPEKIAVGHCTGDKVLCQLAQRFPDKFIFPASGLRIPLE